MENKVKKKSGNLVSRLINYLPSPKALAVAGMTTLGSLFGLNSEAQIYRHPINIQSPTNENGYELNNMKTKAQRDSLLQERLNEDWVSEIPTSPMYDCDERSNNIVVNFSGIPDENLIYNYGEDTVYNGYSGMDLNETYANQGTLKDNGKYGFPVLFVYVNRIGVPNSEYTENHAITMMYTGNGPITDFSNLNFSDSKEDSWTNIQPGEYPSMPNNCELYIQGPPFGYDKDVDISPLGTDYILTFKLTDRVPELTYVDPMLITERDTTPPKNIVYSPLEGEVFNTNNVNFSGRVDDKNFKEANCSINGGEKISLSENWNKTLNLENGNYQLVINSKDYFSKDFDLTHYFDHADSDTINFTVDKPNSLENKVLDDFKLNVYPNPTIDGKTNIKVYSDKFNKLYTEIYSLDGRLIDYEVDEVSAGENLIDVDLSGKAPGVYLLNITLDGETKTEKVNIR